MWGDPPPNSCSNDPTLSPALSGARRVRSTGSFPRAAAAPPAARCRGNGAPPAPRRERRGGRGPRPGDRLARLALSELCGMGPLDRIWADRSVRAVFVNGPAAIYVERKGAIEPSPERFRDQAHLSEVVGRLARRSSSGAVPLRLRDGGEGMVIFPPAAPAGPLPVLRPGVPGHPTFAALIAARTLAR